MDGKWKVCFPLRQEHKRTDRQRNTGLMAPRHHDDHGVPQTDRPARRPSMEAAGRGWFGSSSRDPPFVARLVAGPSVGFNPPQIDPTRKAYMYDFRNT